MLARASRRYDRASASARLRQNRKLLPRRGTERASMRLACMRRSWERGSDGVAGALVMHLCVYCAVGGMFRARAVLPDAADAAAQPGDGRAQAFANHAKLRRSAALRARSRQAQCQTRAGAGNYRRRDAAGGRREAGNEETENPDHEPESNPPGTPTTTTTRHDALRAATVLRRLSADVLMFAS